MSVIIYTVQDIQIALGRVYWYVQAVLHNIVGLNGMPRASDDLIGREKTAPGYDK